ncbi:hypothetical protein AYI69_g7595 [Smittium culicis]|uniref:Uncharacterized protein n=1 Tax=Smittium culicis TaxID=133412 RepID=A0A1R1XR10_9FUNG|nr:hypothetical protein AYI69_g7595 [Smittium culicis]
MQKNYKKRFTKSSTGLSPRRIKFTARDSICLGVSGYGPFSILRHRNTTARRNGALIRATRSSSNRNSAIDCGPLAVNSKLFSIYRRTDSAIYDTQYRLSATTKPINLFVHEYIQGGRQVLVSKDNEFSYSIREAWNKLTDRQWVLQIIKKRGPNIFQCTSFHVQVSKADREGLVETSGNGLPERDYKSPL